MNPYLLYLFRLSFILFIGLKASASISDTSILGDIGIDKLKIGSTYEIVLSSVSCYSRGSTVWKITRNECGYSLTGSRFTTNKYEKRKLIHYKIAQLSNSQLDSLRSFELILSQLLRQNDTGTGGYIGRASFTISQEGQAVYFTETSGESKLFPKLNPLLIEAED